MTVGEVRWVEMPARGGHAQAGRRPAVIVQSVTDLPTTLVVPLTSQLDALRFNGTVLVEADSQNGLRRPSVALVFQLTAVDRRHIADRLGSVSKEVLEEIGSALDKLTGR
ncbi:MAG TPA: type II toxin-antitoxin system PemK/MazF family toxin [Pyrinomonadaceae bacterium]